jgi:hypothetical protein
MKGKYFRPREIEAIVAGRKVVFREVIKPQPKGCTVAVVPSMSSSHWQSRWPVDLRTLYPNSEPTTMIGDIHRSPYQVGETVYIKEEWATELRYNNLKPSEIPYTAKIFYANDGVGEWPVNLAIGMMRSTLHLPEVFARYFLKITDVRAERLQEITVEDIRLEGVEQKWLDAKGYFKQLWDSINKDYPWESNPWVFRYEFELAVR